MENLLLGYNKNDLNLMGAIHTASEINGQPDQWLRTWDLLIAYSSELKNFLSTVYEKQDLQIVLTGAGTSAFIGNALESVFQTHTGINCRSIPTTTLVTHPRNYFQKEKPTLLISFARSGNSPESIKAVELADEACDNVYHLIITCDANGQLAKNISNNNGYLFVLPEETNDKSLAMTSSFTSMLLSGILISRINELDSLRHQVELLSSYAKNILGSYLPVLTEIARMDFNRVVFLGSGSFEGIARESHLKLQELTNGKIICKHDSFLGFRHGPKAVIDDKTLVVFLFSNNSYVQSYEKDLVESVHKENNALHTLAVLEKDLNGVNVNNKIILSRSNEVLEESFLIVVSVLPAQILGFYKSLNFGLKPDSPSENGSINRVVQGVNLYAYSD